jgi:hypothetical protein
MTDTDANSGNGKALGTSIGFPMWTGSFADN